MSMSDANEITTLLFRPDNPCNSTIYLGPSISQNANINMIDTTPPDYDDLEVLYRVKTTYEPKVVTTVYAGDGDGEGGEVVGSFEWREVRSDIVTFGRDGVKMSSGEWLKKSLVPFKDTVTFTDEQGRKFKWKGFSVGLSLELFSEHDKSQLIARFIPSRRIPSSTSPSATSPPSNSPTSTTTLAPSHTPNSTTLLPARLLLTPLASSPSLCNSIVLSFLLLEKSRRAREKSTNNHADSAATPMSRSYALTGGGV